MAVEFVAGVQRETALQIEALSTIVAALHELKPYIKDTELLNITLAVADELQKGELSSPDDVNKLMLFLLFLSTIFVSQFVQHFAASAGDDLGHAAAEKLIQGLSQLTQILPHLLN